jgi:hypothetical protein
MIMAQSGGEFHDLEIVERLTDLADALSIRQ